MSPWRVWLERGAKLLAAWRAAIAARDSRRRPTPIRRLRHAPAALPTGCDDAARARTTPRRRALLAAIARARERGRRRHA